LSTSTGSYIAEIALTPGEPSLAQDLACSLVDAAAWLADDIYNLLSLDDEALSGHTAVIDLVGVCESCDEDICLSTTGAAGSSPATTPSGTAQSPSAQASSSMAGAVAGAAIGALLLVVLVVALVWMRTRRSHKPANVSAGAVMYPNPLFDPSGSRRPTMDADFNDSAGGFGFGMPAPYVGSGAAAHAKQHGNYIDVDDDGPPAANYSEHNNNYIECSDNAVTSASGGRAPQDERDYMLPTVDPTGGHFGDESYELPLVRPAGAGPAYDEAIHGDAGASYQDVDGAVSRHGYERPRSDGGGPQYHQFFNVGDTQSCPHYDLPAESSTGGHSYAEPVQPHSAVYTSASAAGGHMYEFSREHTDAQSHLPAGFYDGFGKCAEEPIYESPGETAQATHRILEKYAEEISSHRITVHETLGSGAFGVVQRGELASATPAAGGGVMVAIKQLADATLEQDRLAFLQEAAIQAQFRHPNIVALLGVVTRTQPTQILLELCEEGELYKMLLTGVFSDERKLQVAGDVAEVSVASIKPGMRTMFFPTVQAPAFINSQSLL
jgi:hypothetical protein